ncbi:MAG TPA: DUF4363 family protein [Peptococcaceae bacterium]|nr:DUF4363 family protein [Peptococcaceae bacterium]
MRSTIAILVGFAILVGSSIFINYKIDDTSEDIRAQLIQAEFDLRANNWDTALEKINQTYEQWSKAKNWWAMLLNHSTINSIDISYLRLQQFVGNQDLTLSLAELKVLLLLLEDVPKSETVRLKNIL